MSETDAKDTVAGLERLRVLVGELGTALARDGRCRLDRHGYCDTHTDFDHCGQVKVLIKRAEAEAKEAK